MSFPALSQLNVTMGAGQWSDITGVFTSAGRERVMPVIRIGYTVTLAGLTSPEAFAVVHVTPPSTPVVGPSGKALRCHGAGPLGSLSAEFVSYRQWAVADVDMDFTQGGVDASEGITVELWFLLENLEGQEDLERLASRFVLSLGGGDEAAYTYYSDSALDMASHLPQDQKAPILGSGYDSPARAWTHLAVHIYPSNQTTITMYINGEERMEQLGPEIPFDLYQGLFLCGRPAFASDGEVRTIPAPTMGFEGGIDEVRLWRGKRSLEEIKAWMFRRLDPAELSPEDQGRLMGHWDFEDDGVVAASDADGGSEGRILDRSGNGNDLVLGGCHVPTDVPNPPSCEGSNVVAPNSNHIPTIYYPQPESPVTDGALSVVEVEMGEHPVVRLEGYDPEVLRCPESPSTECRDADLDRVPRFFLDEVPTPGGGGGASLWVIEGGEGDGEEEEGVELTEPASWSTWSNDLIRIVPTDPMAGGRPFTALSYHLTSPVTGVESTVKQVDVNIRCGAGHMLNVEASQCVLCPFGSYRQTPSYEQACCDLRSPAEGCFRCDPGFVMKMGEGVAPPGTVACELPPCGQYDTTVLLENGLQECVPSFDLPPSTRDAMTGVTGAVLLFVLAVAAAVFKYRKTRVIINSSRPFLMLMLLGLLLMTVAVGVLVHPQTPLLCGLKTGLFHVGFSLMFASAVAKTWRLHKIFNNKRLVRVQVKVRQLYRIVIAFVGVDVVLVALWLIVAPFEVPNEMQKVCESDQMGVFFGLLLLSKAVLMASGCWLTYQVRGVPSSFNESAGITLTLNNVTLMAVLVLGVTNGMEAQLNEGGITKILQAMGGLVGVLAPLIFIFLPKFRNAVTNQKQAAVTGMTTSNRGGPATSYGENGPEGGAEASTAPKSVKVEKLRKLEAKLMKSRRTVATLQASLKKQQEELKKTEKKMLRDQDEVDYMREDPAVRDVVFTPEELEGNATPVPPSPAVSGTAAGKTVMVKTTARRGSAASDSASGRTVVGGDSSSSGRSRRTSSVSGTAAATAAAAAAGGAGYAPVVNDKPSPAPSSGRDRRGSKVVPVAALEEEVGSEAENESLTGGVAGDTVKLDVVAI